MKIKYDTYYQTKNLFGDPYPELIEFYSKIEEKGKLLDLGCGQGRDAIPLAKLGFSVTGIDHSKVGIDQLNKIAKRERLPLIGKVGDIYNYPGIEQFNHILLDSMFHFGAKEKAKEINFLNRLFEQSGPDTLITICIQKNAKKVEILESVIRRNQFLVYVQKTDLVYEYIDQESDHRSKSDYQMITVKKI